MRQLLDPTSPLPCKIDDTSRFNTHRWLYCKGACFGLVLVALDDAVDTGIRISNSQLMWKRQAGWGYLESPDAVLDWLDFVGRR